MKCEQVRQLLPLWLYGELSFDEEEAFEAHASECGECERELARQKALHRLLDAIELPVSAAALARSRRKLADAVSASPEGARGWRNRLRDLFDLRVHPVRAFAQPIGAVALLLIGFLASRSIQKPGTGLDIAALGEPIFSRVRALEPEQKGKVQLVVEETRQRVLSGDVNDAAIRRLLVSAARESADPGLRVESVEALRNNRSAEVKQALLSALQHDENAGVRLKALDGLKAFAGDPQVTEVLAQVLLNDKNPGVRTQVIDLLVQRKEDPVVGALQRVMETEDNSYVRMRCQRALRDMNASVETF